MVAEYLRALVLTGQLSEYASASALPDRGEDHRSLSQLLREMQALVGDADFGINGVQGCVRV